jgi:DNA-directed RNA polymerase subunit RPC12/RpoP
MSKLIKTWTLNSEQQDNLWKNYCPICGSKIIITERNVDFARWLCERCDTLFLCE